MAVDVDVAVDVHPKGTGSRLDWNQLARPGHWNLFLVDVRIYN